MTRGCCPLCGVVFTAHEPYRVHLNEVHLLFDDPGTESRLPELIEMPDEPAEEEPEPIRGVPVAPVGVPTLVPVTTPDAEPPPAAEAPKEPPPTEEPVEEPGAQPPAEESVPAGEAPGAFDPVRRRWPRVPVPARLAVAAVAVGLVVALEVSQRSSPPAEANDAPVPPTTSPAVAEPASEAPPSTAAEYVVERGDTLSAIANRFGVPVAVLAAENGVAQPDLIFPGQVLRIPATGG